MPYLFEDFIRSFHLARELPAWSIVFPVFCCDLDFVSYTEVYLSLVFISLSRISLLSSCHIFLCALPGLVKSGDERFDFVSIKSFFRRAQAGS